MSELPQPRDGRGCVVMGVLNVTTDSFSDGGRYVELAGAVAHGVALHAAGADIVDVGGESTRPGAERVPAEVEAGRVVPVIRELTAAGVPVSVDTMRAQVAREALAAGATVVNDVSGGLADPRMVEVIAQAGVPWILMHWRADPGHRHAAAARYDDVVAEVTAELSRQADRAIGAGVDPGRIVLDPGLGFAKNAQHNWELLHALPALCGLGFPVLVGASRKRFLGALLASGAEPRPADGREIATAVVSALAAAHGAWGVRVHDVRASADAVKVAQAWTHATAGSVPGVSTVRGG